MQFTVANRIINPLMLGVVISVAFVVLLIQTSLETDLESWFKPHFSTTRVSRLHDAGFHVFSFATNPNNAILQLLLTSSPYSIEVLGKNQKWRGLRHKFEELYAYLLRNHLQNSDDIVLFVDGYDGLFAPGDQNLIKKFKAFNKPLVISAETNCAHHPMCQKDSKSYPVGPKNTPFQYVNSGTYIGYGWAVYGMLDEVLNRYPDKDKDDQFLMHEFFLKHPDQVALDYQQEIFSLLFGTKFEDFSYDQKTGLIRNDITNSTPVIFHGNGGSHLLLIKLYKNYGGPAIGWWTNTAYYGQMLLRLGVVRSVSRMSNMVYSLWLQYTRNHCNWLAQIVYKSTTLDSQLRQRLIHSLLWDAYFEQLAP